jgi:hypothetical protein
MRERLPSTQTKGSTIREFDFMGAVTLRYRPGFHAISGNRINNSVQMDRGGLREAQVFNLFIDSTRRNDATVSASSYAHISSTSPSHPLQHRLSGFVFVDDHTPLK